jgi:hypothetical protein
MPQPLFEYDANRNVFTFFLPENTNAPQVIFQGEENIETVEPQTTETETLENSFIHVNDLENNFQVPIDSQKDILSTSHVYGSRREPVENLEPEQPTPIHPLRAARIRHERESLKNYTKYVVSPRTEKIGRKYVTERT